MQKMKEYDDTENEETTIEEVLEAITATMATFKVRILALEKEVTLLLEQRETARSPEGGEVDPEWYGGC